MQLIPLTEDIWTVGASHSMFGLHLGSRMTVVRLPSGGLWLHSPVAHSPELQTAIDGLGPVEHIVAPNYFHHMYVGPWARAYPDATLHSSPGLEKKR